MKKLKYVLFGILALGILGAIFKPKKGGTKIEKTKTEILNTANKVSISKKLAIDLDNAEFWDQYDPIVKVRVYNLIDKKDCAGLQQEFNTTADNMDKLQASGKSAIRNLDLMDFLEDQMEKLNCNN